MTITVEVPGFGTYESDNDLYDQVVRRGTEELREHVREVTCDVESITLVSDLFHCELAGMVAEWETGARTNERQADRVAAETEAVRQRRADEGRTVAALAARIAEKREEITAAVPELSTPSAVITNVSELTPAMRRALLDEHGRPNTIEALRKRHLAWRDGPVRGSHTSLTLTDAGRRAADVLRAEMDATPIVPIANEPVEMVTVSVPRHLAETVFDAWVEAYRAGTDDQESRFLALAEAYDVLRAEIVTSEYGWLNKALLDASCDAAAAAKLWEE